MRSAIPDGFGAVFRTEVLFNLKRVAPYALIVLFSLNALMWWGWGPAIARGWAVNSDFYIVWLFGGFSFMTMPLFVALMMGDPVIRDFRLRVDPLIFSKPVRPAEYLLGKFFGNFFVLVCCLACFALTPLLFQAFNREGMIVLPPRVIPYFQHFFFFAVISGLAMAALFFTVGTLTRNVKIVYGLAVSFYPLYFGWQMIMKGLPGRWRVALDPLLFNFGADSWQGRNADWLNHLTVLYDGDMIANRLLLILFSLVCMAILHARFSETSAQGRDDTQSRVSILDLNEGDVSPHGDNARVREAQDGPARVTVAVEKTELPPVNIAAPCWRETYAQLSAAIGVEFRLLRAERSLIVVAPLVVFVCVLGLAAYKVVPDTSYSAAYAGRLADSLLLFLFGVAVFYSGEMMHRDRELGIEPLLWSTPAPDMVFLLSKFALTLLLSISLIVVVGLAAAGLQIFKGDGPVQSLAYLKTCAVILVPSALFMCAAAVALNVLLRDKYLTYVASLAAAGAIYFLSGQGFNTWLYNPVLLNLWTPNDLASGGGTLTRILFHRIYSISLSVFLLALAFLFFQRRSTSRSKILSSSPAKRLAPLIAAASALLAAITGFMVYSAG